MTVQGPVKEQQLDGMSHGGGGGTASLPVFRLVNAASTTARGAIEALSGAVVLRVRAEWMSPPPPPTCPIPPRMAHRTPPMPHPHIRRPPSDARAPAPGPAAACAPQTESAADDLVTSHSAPPQVGGPGAGVWPRPSAQSASAPRLGVGAGAPPSPAARPLGSTLDASAWIARRPSADASPGAARMARRASSPTFTNGRQVRGPRVDGGSARWGAAPCAGRRLHWDPSPPMAQGDRSHYRVPGHGTAQILIGPFWVHKLSGPRPPPPSDDQIPRPCANPPPPF